MKSFSHPSVRRSRGAFALVITLLILSLLVIVSVSYLSSMTAERQTADAYGSKAVAEQAAQTGVDNATAMLAQSFRDFPDSATVWDTAQTINSGTPSNAAIVNSANNEGTNLYLRAVPSAQDASAYALALPHSTVYAAGGIAFPSNDSAGNNPNNPACKTFVLPLISGVPNGQARLVSLGSPMPPASAIFPAKMNLGESDPTKQNWTDLNIRRLRGDIQGIIGSPPNWTGVGPKPARAYWINLKGSNGLITGRYAFWIEDESFRLNTSFAGASGQTSADTVWPTDSSGKLRSLQPGDLTITGPLTKAADGNAVGDAATVVNTRSKFPGGFFPDSLAFAHGSLTTSAIDTLRYLTTNQSGSLNLSRHGSQRLNLNSTISTTTTTSVIQTQVNRLVQTLEYHLPNFGERFYRTNPGALNDATQVPGSPYSGTYSSGTDSSHSQIYYYKTAANLRDYVDTDNQPTMIGTGGIVMGPPANADLGDTTDSPAEPNVIWAQGKESTPYIQEVAVRYRPVVTTTANATPTNPKGHYKLSVDYYIEFWNMSDRDISASQMNGPTVWIRDQQPWHPYLSTYLLQSDTYPPNGEALRSNQTPADTQLSLSPSTDPVTGATTPIMDAAGTAYPNGVIFRAGTVTVITSDPNCSTYTYKELVATTASQNPNSPALLPNFANVFICPVISGSRVYSGKVTATDGSVTTNGGVELGGDFYMTSPYTGTEVSLVNSLGYFDVVRGAITKTGAYGYNVYTNTDRYTAQQGYVNDFSYGSSMMGNVADTGGPMPTVSQLGDPRTNNEQLSVSVANVTADGTRFMVSSRTLGSPNFKNLQPEIVTTPMLGWPDYYKFPVAVAGVYPSPDATTAPAVIAGTTTADGAITSVGQLGDVFDPARVPGANILYSHGGGRTFKIGQHDDLYSDDPTTNVYAASNSPVNTADNVAASNGWASWRLTDIFDTSDAIQLPGRVNINGIMRDNGAAFLSALQGFVFQPKTISGTSDANIHGDGTAGLAGASLDTTGTSNGFAQIIAQMKQRLDPATAPKVKPFFERGELSELGFGSGSTPLFGTNPTSGSSANNTLVASVDMNKTADHSREEIFRRLAEMICTRGNTFTVYTAGQSIIQTSTTGPLKITGTQRMRVTFRLVPKAKDPMNPTTASSVDFHPAYITSATDGTISRVNAIDPANPTEQLTASGQIGVIPRFAKPDSYDVQILQAISY